MERRWASDDAAATPKPTEEQLEQRVETEQISEESPAAEEAATEDAAVKAASGEKPAGVVEEVVTEADASAPGKF